MHVHALMPVPTQPPQEAGGWGTFLLPICARPPTTANAVRCGGVFTGLPREGPVKGCFREQRMARWGCRLFKVVRSVLLTDPPREGPEFRPMQKTYT